MAKTSLPSIVRAQRQLDFDLLSSCSLPALRSWYRHRLLGTFLVLTEPFSALAFQLLLPVLLIATALEHGLANSPQKEPLLAHRLLMPVCSSFWQLLSSFHLSQCWPPTHLWQIAQLLKIWQSYGLFGAHSWTCYCSSFSCWSISTATTANAPLNSCSIFYHSWGSTTNSLQHLLQLHSP